MHINDLKSAFGKFLTGVTVVTTKTPDATLLGFTANSFTSVSIDPPILLVCLGRQLSSFGYFQQADSFAINVLSENQANISTIFAMSKEDRFAQVDWDYDELENPILSNVAAYFSCQTYDRQIVGDHMILFGKVISCKATDLQGLGYTQRQYVRSEPL